MDVFLETDTNFVVKLNIVMIGRQAPHSPLTQNLQKLGDLVSEDGLSVQAKMTMVILEGQHH